MGIMETLASIRNRALGIDHLSHTIRELGTEVQKLQKANAAFASTLNPRICPVCLKSAPVFLPYGQSNRADAKCPNCGSAERHRLLWLYLNRETDIFKGPARVLHFAPERCFRPLLKAAQNIDYITADRDGSIADVAVDIQQLPFENNGFDFVLCCHVLEHIPDDRKAIREVFRVLKEGGVAILMVPLRHNAQETLEGNHGMTDEERTRSLGQPDHLRYYGLDFGERLQEAGFQTEALDYASRFDDVVKKVFGLSNELIHICRK